MTEQMAVEHIRNLAGDYKCWDDRLSREESLILCKLLEELEQYRALGTVEELRVARDKQIPKKHHHTRIDRIDDCVRVSICPSCLRAVYTYKEEYPKYCSNCGNKIDWSDEDE